MRKNWSELAVYLIAILVAVLRLFSLPDYPVHDDELITLDVLASIKKTGLPLLGEKIYWRSLVAHYLMAVPQFFLNSTLETARIVPVIAGSFLLVFCYRIGRELAGPLAGLMAAAFLGFSVYENLYTAFARFYLPFQFFFVASLWYAYLYFVKKRHDKFWHWLLFTAAALGSHRFGLLLWPAVLFAFILGKDFDRIHEKKLWAATLFLLVWSYWLCFWFPAGAYGTAVAIDLSAGYLKDKLVFVRLFREWLPLGTTFCMVCLAPVIRHRGPWLYFYCVLVAGMCVMSLMAPADNPRYVLHLFPLAVVMAMAGFVWLVRSTGEFIAGWQEQRIFSFDKAAVVAMCFLVLILIPFDNRKVATAFGRSITFVNQAPAHDFLRKNLLSSDIVITVDPGITRHYLGNREVRFLREKLDIHTGAYKAYDAKIKIGNRAYYIDSRDALARVLSENDTNVWLYANNKIKWAVSTETDQLIREQFDLVFKFDETWLLVHRPHRK